MTENNIAPNVIIGRLDKENEIEPKSDQGILESKSLNDVHYFVLIKCGLTIVSGGCPVYEGHGKKYLGEFGRP